MYVFELFVVSRGHRFDQPWTYSSAFKPAESKKMPRFAERVRIWAVRTLWYVDENIKKLKLKNKTCSFFYPPTVLFVEISGL